MGDGGSQDLEMSDLVIEPESIVQLMQAFLQAADSKSSDSMEETGCTLWDLTVSEGAGEVLIAAGALDAMERLVSGLLVSGQAVCRPLELAIGICANLASHKSATVSLGMAPQLAHQVAQVRGGCCRGLPQRADPTNAHLSSV